MRTEGYYGEIRAFAGDAVPDNWLPCNGQLMKISDHQAVYSLFGNAYGGDGRTNFALPDLRARVPVSADYSNHGAKLRASSHSLQIQKEEQPLLALSFCICMGGDYPTRG